MTELTIVKNEIDKVQAETASVLDQLTGDTEQQGVEVHVVCDDQPEQTITAVPEMEAPVLFDHIREDHEPVVDAVIAEPITTEEADVEPTHSEDTKPNDEEDTEMDMENIKVVVTVDPFAFIGGAMGALTSYAVNKSVAGAVAGVVGGIVVSTRNGKTLAEEGRLENRSKLELAGDFAAGFGTACTLGLLAGGLANLCFGDASDEIEIDEV